MQLSPRRDRTAQAHQSLIGYTAPPAATALLRLYRVLVVDRCLGTMCLRDLLGEQVFLERVALMA